MKAHPRCLLSLFLIVGFVGTAFFYTPMAYAGDLQKGWVIAGVNGGKYNVYDGTGVFIEVLDNGLGGFTTGCAQGPDTNLYTTAFSSTKVVVFDWRHAHNIVKTIDTNADCSGGHSESIVFDGSGNFYVGHPDGCRDILKYDAAGNFVQAYDVPIERRGSDWMDLAIDQKTMFYTSEGSRVMRYDVAADVALADFAAIGGISYALRLLAPFDGSGGLIVANTGDVKRLDGGGNVVQTYDVAGEDCWFAMNLDPDGTSFWAGDFCTDNFYKFDIATGNVLVGPINTGPGGNLFGLCVVGEITGATQKVVRLDIKPQSCPNPFNMKNFLEEPKNSKSMKGGVLPVAILGGQNFDVTDIDISTLLLEGVAPVRWSFEDVATPVDSDEECACTTEGPDGFVDLTLKFKSREIADALEPASDGDVRVLTLTGKLKDGTDFDASDCVRILDKHPDPLMFSGDGSAKLGQPYPNPFNPITRISYSLAKTEHVRLAVYDIAGHLIAVLREGVQPAGEYGVEWDADGLASGVYYFRLDAGGVTRVTRVVLLK